MSFSPHSPSDPQLQAVEHTVDLLRSLQSSILRLRNACEHHLADLDAEEAASPDPAGLKPQISKLESVIRDLQKVERILVEHQHSQQQDDTLDLDAARDEIERRLAGLHELFLADLAAG